MILIINLVKIMNCLENIFVVQKSIYFLNKVKSCICTYSSNISHCSCYFHYSLILKYHWWVCDRWKQVPLLSCQFFCCLWHCLVFWRFCLDAFRTVEHLEKIIEWLVLQLHLVSKVSTKNGDLLKITYWIFSMN